MSSRARTKATNESGSPRGPRLTPEARRKQLLEVASGIVGEHGVEKLEIRDLAVRAGVTRPVVYRYFPTRRALVLALLEDFADVLGLAYRDALVQTIGQPLEVITRGFVAASCDVIAEKGAGPWHLLAMRGGDPEVTALGQSIHDRLLAPWLGRIAELTSLTRAEVRVLVPIVAMSARAAIDAWIDGRLARKRAIEMGTRAIVGVLREFGGGLGGA